MNNNMNNNKNNDGDREIDWDEYQRNPQNYKLEWFVDSFGWLTWLIMREKTEEELLIERLWEEFEYVLQEIAEGRA